MEADKQSARLKQRISQWQTYVACERSQVRIEPGDAAPDAGATVAGQEDSHQDSTSWTATNGTSDAAYQKRLAELSQQLEAERARTEKLKTEFYQEILRRRPTAPSRRRWRFQKHHQLRLSARQSRPPARKTSTSGLDLSAWAIIGLSVLIAGICTLVVVLTNLP